MVYDENEKKPKYVKNVPVAYFAKRFRSVETICFYFIFFFFYEYIYTYIFFFRNILDKKNLIKTALDVKIRSGTRIR
jgi:hypothetical protein